MPKRENDFKKKHAGKFYTHNQNEIAAYSSKGNCQNYGVWPYLKKNSNMVSSHHSPSKSEEYLTRLLSVI